MERLYSGLPPPAIPLRGIPLLAHPVPAGIPSPIGDWISAMIDLNEYLMQQPAASFLLRAKGDSMAGFGIHPGDTLLVDRSIEVIDRSIVVAEIDGEFTVKQLCRLPHGVLLRAGNTEHKDILIGEAGELSIWGVVCWCFHPLTYPLPQPTAISLPE
jgi:DNA polymerase V